MIKNIKIKPALNGYIVTVGCQTVVFASRKKLLRELERYLTAPEEVEKEYTQKAVNKKHRVDELVPPASAPVRDWRFIGSQWLTTTGVVDDRPALDIDYRNPDE